MKAKDQLRNEILATARRYALESEVSIIETIQACQEVVEIIVRAALDAKGETD